MVKEEIVEGLRQAVSKGENLEKAMITFYNAGYLKEDIEEAARALSTPNLQPAGAQQQKVLIQTYKPLPMQQTQAPRVIQRISSYEKPPRIGGTITIVLFVLLLILFGILAAVIIFKDELISLFSFLRILL